MSEELKYYKDVDFVTAYVAHYARVAMITGFFAGYSQALCNRDPESLTAKEHEYVEMCNEFRTEDINHLATMNKMINIVLSGGYNVVSKETNDMVLYAMDREIESAYDIGSSATDFNTLGIVLNAVNPAPLNKKEDISSEFKSFSDASREIKEGDNE